MDFLIECQLCHKTFKGFVTHSHLRAAHDVTVAEYRAMGHPISNPDFYKDIGERKAMDNHPCWKGGRFVFSNGYVYVRKDGCYQLEHRVIMAEHLGRSLSRDEVVHHIDGNRQNNALENLELTINGVHVTQHLKRERQEGRVRHGRGHVTLTCEQCGKVYTVTYSRGHRQVHHFCSQSCHYSAMRMVSATNQSNSYATNHTESDTAVVSSEAAPMLAPRLPYRISPALT
jgi:hypothetical protein